MKKLTSLLFILLFSFGLKANASEYEEETVTETTETADLEDGFSEPNEKKIIYTFPIREDIMPGVVRQTKKCLDQATEMNADYVIINMNTYGGLVNAADSIRTMLLNYPRPTMTLINNQAASAGALIALATDSIYMRSGASIGAATVVDQSGADLPDKYQSFMRSMMRSTAEAHGKIPVIEGADTVWKWRRDPQIAQGMVDPTIVIPGLVDDTKVVTLTADEAIEWGFCEGKAASVEEVLDLIGVYNYDLYEYERTGMDRFVGFMTNPTLQAILIMMIIGGIYFELQTPGVGFPLIIAVLGAILYFLPLYLEGILANWELLLFIVGLVLMILEIFVTPGFGALGILGIIAIICGLAFALIDTSLLEHIPSGALPISIVITPFMIVIISIGVALLLSIWLGNRFLQGNSLLRNRIVLQTDMTAHEGYVSVAAGRGLVGHEGVTSTPLRPAGKIVVNGRHYEAAGDNAAFIEKGVRVIIVRDESGILYCREITD